MVDNVNKAVAPEGSQTHLSLSGDIRIPPQAADIE